MFRSIRWRLVASYVLLTLLTVSVLGILGFMLVRQYIERQETASLSANAEAIARQAQPLMRPHVDLEDLLELATASSFLGNVRVRILDSDHEVLVDSGPPAEIDQFLWIHSQEREFQIGSAQESFGTFIVTLPFRSDNDLVFFPDLPLRILEELPEEVQYNYVQRMFHPWGNRFIFAESSEQSLDEESTRSGRIYAFPIGVEESPLGYVELRDGPNFASQAIETAAGAFLSAALGALVLSGIVGILMARRLTSPLVELTGTASRMGEGDLTIRAPQYGRDEIGQLAQQFNVMAERLQTSFAELASERDTLRRFIADASHELRTPITVLRSFIDLLQGKAKDDKDARAEFLAESQAQVNRLGWITENLLNISRLEAGLTTLELEEHDLGEMLDAVVTPHKIRAENEGIKLLVDRPELETKLVADRPLIELAISNLVDNALKFTPRGGQVQIGASRGANTTRFWVRDSGPGIHPEDRPHIFERFCRSRRTNVGGSGLGLAMVDSVAKAHGGQVHVESELGTGSYFELQLPHEALRVSEENGSLATDQSIT